MQHAQKWLEAGEHLRAALAVLAELDEELCTGQQQMFACFVATETARSLSLVTNALRKSRQLADLAEWERCRTCGGVGVRRTLVDPCNQCDGTGRRAEPHQREVN